MSHNAPKCIRNSGDVYEIDKNKNTQPDNENARYLRYSLVFTSRRQDV